VDAGALRHFGRDKCKEYILRAPPSSGELGGSTLVHVRGLAGSTSAVLVMHVCGSLDVRDDSVVLKFHRV